MEKENRLKTVCKSKQALWAIPWPHSMTRAVCVLVLINSTQYSDRSQAFPRKELIGRFYDIFYGYSNKTLHFPHIKTAQNHLR